jgi:hypothetical protein
MSQTYTRSDAVDVKTLKLVSIANPKKNFDMTLQCVGFSIYEDVTFPVIRAEFTMMDGLDVLTSFPIIGEEYIDVEFGNPGIDVTASYRFHVKSVENVINNSQAKNKSYVIRAVSEEFFQNNVQYISKRFNGDVGGIIQSIMQTQLNTKKQVAIGDNVKGVHEVLVSRQRPFQCIDMMRKRAVSAKYTSSSYVFFENRRGYNFTSLEFLMDHLKDSVQDKVFFYDTAAQTDPRNMNTRNILTLKNVSQVNNTKKMTQGGLNSIVKRFDILTGKTTTTQYKNSEQQSKFKYAAKKPIGLNTTNFEQKFGNTATSSMLLPHSSHLPENFIADQMGAKHAFITKISQNIYQAHINGDVALTVGDVITINIPSAQGATGAQGDNRLLAGNYLVIKLRHIVLNFSSAQKSYTCALELVKGFNEDYS